MKGLLSIGEMSKVNNISIQRLRYYDTIGLFKPAQVDEKTGYRYYTASQSRFLSQIQGLQYAGLTLKEIATLTQLTNMQEWKKQFDRLEQRMITKEKRLHLQKNLIHAYQESLACSTKKKKSLACFIPRRMVFLMETGSEFSKAAWCKHKPAFIKKMKQHQLSKSYLPFISAKVNARSEKMDLFIILRESHPLSSHICGGKCLKKTIEFSEVASEMAVMKKKGAASYFIIRPLVDLDINQKPSFVLETYLKEEKEDDSSHRIF